MTPLLDQIRQELGPMSSKAKARKLLKIMLEGVREEELTASRDHARTASVALEWQPIDSAPKDGTHILACQDGSSFGWWNGKQAPPVQTVVHWWGNPGEEGFYTSVNEMEPQHPFNATHWKPLDGVSA